VTAILAGIAGLATIVGGLAYMMKAGIWIFRKTEEQKTEAILTQEQTLGQKIEDSGRPQ